LEKESQVLWVARDDSSAVLERDNHGRVDDIGSGRDGQKVADETRPLLVKSKDVEALQKSGECPRTRPAPRLGQRRRRNGDFNVTFGRRA
jgi:hypothetical protein